MTRQKRSTWGVLLGTTFLLMAIGAIVYRTGYSWNMKRQEVMKPPMFDENHRRAVGQAEILYDQGFTLACYRQYSEALTEKPEARLTLQYGHFEECADSQLREIARSERYEELRDFLKVNELYKQHEGLRNSKYDLLLGSLPDLMFQADGERSVTPLEVKERLTSSIEQVVGEKPTFE